MNNENSVMIGLFPMTNDWCRIEVPHMTLVYAGEKNKLKPSMFNELAKDASALSLLSGPLQLRVTGVEIFGSDGEEKVNVFTLLPSPELWSMRRAVERWNASEHPFRPHVTVGPQAIAPSYVPTHLAFDRICVGWGSEYITFSLRK